MYTENQSIRDRVAANGALIAAHRGTSGANVIQNTSLAYKNALLHGADMVEMDASMTVDGVFYAFHNGEEMLEFGVSGDIREMTSREAGKLVPLNGIRHETKQRLERVKDVLEGLRGKCLINIDRSWFYWKEILLLLAQMDMKDQILLKSGVEENLLKELADSATGIMYMPILKSTAEWETVKRYDVNVAAAELIFEDMDSDFLKPAFMGELKAAGIVPWVNAITLDDDTVLSGLLDDNHAISDGFDGTWGKLVDLGFEIIQTDWPAPLKGYLTHRFGHK